MASPDDMTDFHRALNPLAPDTLGSPYLDIQMGYLTQNRALRLVIAVLAVNLTASCYALYRVATRPPERIIVRVDPSGAATVAPPVILSYEPREVEIKYHLRQWIKDHYSRIRATYREAFARKLFFVSEDYGRTMTNEQAKLKSIENFVMSGEDEVEVFVHNVSIEDMRSQPYRVVAEFSRISHNRQGDETNREKYIGHYQIRFRDSVPENVLAVNPLGMVITHFTEDKALAEDTRQPR